MGICIIVVLAVAGQSSEKDSLILFIPLVDRKKDEFLLDSPCIRQSYHKRAVNHVPSLTVILLLHVKYLEDCRTGFSDRKTSELSEDIRLSHSAGITHHLDLVDNLLRHVLVIEIACK